MTDASRILGDLHKARGWLTVQHAKADRLPIQAKAVRLPAIRAAMAAVEVAIESASMPLDAPDTVAGDFSPTGLHARDFPRTEMATVMEARL